MTLPNEQDFCVLMRFSSPPPKKGLKLFLKKYGCPETSKINLLRPESYYIQMKYTGAKRMPLIYLQFMELVHNSVFLQRNIPQLQAAASIQFLSKNNDFGGDP